MAEHENVLKNIITILGDSSLDESFIEMVLKRLESLTYTIQDGDDWAIAFTIQKVENHIKNFCNISTIPEGLKFVAIDMICGYFLYDKKQTGNLDESFDLETAVKSIQEGDTTVSLAVSDSVTPERMLHELLDRMKAGLEGDLICYRKLKW